MSASLFTDKQLAAAAVVAVVVLWYAKKKASVAVSKIKDIVLGPDVGPPVVTNKRAAERMEEAIKQGYMKRLPNGVVITTAKGEALVASGKSLTEVIGW